MMEQRFRVNMIAGLISGAVAGSCLFVGMYLFGRFGVYIFPPMAGLVFGLLLWSAPEAWRAALAGLVGVLSGMFLFNLAGIFFLRHSAALAKMGLSAHLIAGFTQPYAWGLTLVCATLVRMKGSTKAALLSGAVCFVGVSLTMFAGARLNEWRGAGALAARYLGVFLPLIVDGVILGISVHISA